MTAILASTWLAGGQVHGYSDIPPFLSPVFFLSGVVLVFGALIGLFEPKRLEGWFDPIAEPTMRDVSQYLFALVFGCLVVYWSTMAAVPRWP